MSALFENSLVQTPTRGFPDLEIQEMIGLTAYVNLNITFTKAQPAWMDEP